MTRRTKPLTRFFSIFALVTLMGMVAAPSVAEAKNNKAKKAKKANKANKNKNKNKSGAAAVPELDPNAVGAGLLLLIGGTLVLVGRGRKAPLGAILLRTGLSATNLKAALHQQRGSGGKLGDTLLEMGAIDQQQLDFAIAVQDERLKERARIGTILVSAVGVDAKMVDAALKKQRQSGEMLGDILLSMGAVTQEQMERALEIQNFWHEIPTKSMLAS